MTSPNLIRHPGEGLRRSYGHLDARTTDVWQWMSDRESWEKDRRKQWLRQELMPRLALILFILFSADYGMPLFFMDRSNYIGFTCSLFCFAPLVIKSVETVAHFGDYCFNLANNTDAMY